MNPKQRLLFTPTQLPRFHRLPAYTHTDGRWIYGLWYCGTPFTPARIYGAYPGDFVRRVLMMFPPEGMLHLCCGEAHIDGAVNVDLRADAGACDVVANAEALPFGDASFETVLIDPPYSEEDATRYGLRRLIRYGRVMKEARRVLRPGGVLLWLDEKYPAYTTEEWTLCGLIGVVTGFQRRTRVLAMLRPVDEEEKL